MRGCGMDEKKCMIVDIFKNRKMDILALSETKVKGSGLREWEGQKVIVSGVSERCRAKEGVGIMLSGQMWSRMLDYKCVSSRLMWVKLNLNGEKLNVVSVYAPGMEKKDCERERFWGNLNECIEGFSCNESVIVLGDMNAKVGDREREGIVGKYGVPGENDNGMCLLDMCNERELTVGNTWFEKKLIHKYTWEREGGDERSMIDLILVEKKMKNKLLDVTVRRGLTGGISDHFLVESKLNVGVCKKYVRRNECVKEVVKVSEFDKKEARDLYKALIEAEWNSVKDTRCIGVEGEWERFKFAVLRCAGEVCGYKKLGRKGKRSEWWDDEVRDLVRNKRRAYETYLRTRDERDKNEYKLRNREVKDKVREKKRLVDERWGESLSKNFREKKKLFWKEVNADRKCRDQMDMQVKDVGGNVLSVGENVVRRWRDYFDELLNVDDRREADLSDARVPGVNVNARDMLEVCANDVRKGVKKIKNGKAPGIDGITSEMLKYGGESMIEWLTRMYNVCFVEGSVTKDWQQAVIVPFYKRKGDRLECKNFRDISLLAIPGKVYGRVLIEKVREITEDLIGEEQSGFRMGRGCVDQVFVMEQLSEKCLAKGKSLYVAYMDLEKAYDRVDRSVMWIVLSMYGVSGMLLDAIKSFYVESEACVRVCRKESEWFRVKVGLRQGCVMSPWLFNLFMDGVMREVRETAGEIGVNLVEDS